MNGFSPHLPRLYRQFLHFQTQGCYLEKLLRNKDIPPGTKEDFMFLRHLLLQFPVCRWDRGQQRELKMARSAPKWGKQPLHAQQWGDSQSQQAAHTSFWCCCYWSILEKSIKEGWVLHWRSIFLWTFLYSWCTGLGAAFRNLALEKWFSCVLNFGKTVLPGMTEGGVTK